MTTFDQVIDDLFRTEEPIYCIFSYLGTNRCPVEISREQLERTPPLLSLVTGSDYDVQRLDGQFFSRLLCAEHQNMDIIQGIIQSWLWDQDAMHLSMPGNETPMDSRGSLNNPVSVEVFAPPTPRSPLESEASTPDSRISPSATNNIQEDVSAHHTVGGRRSASRASSSSQSRRRTRESRWLDAYSLQESPTAARVRRRNVRNETQRTASAPEIPTSQSDIAERPQALPITALSDPALSSSSTNLNSQTPRIPLVQSLSIDSIPELMPGSFGSENTGNEEGPPSVQANVESDGDGDSAEAMSIDSVGEITPPASNTEIPSSANRRSIYTIPKIQDAHSIDDALRTKIKEALPKKDKQRGYVYIFRDPARPNLLKIGKTDLEVSKRRETIERRCRITLETVYQEGEGMDLLPFRNCQRAEQLVHKELANYNRRFLCPTCKERHKEWFAVSEDLAKKTVQRWVAFIRKQPYNEKGVLDDFWQERLYFTERPSLNEKPEDHDIRHERWKFVITATYFHFWKHWAWKTVFAVPERDRPRESLYFKLVRFRWQLFAEFSWVVIAVLSYPSVIASSTFVIITCFVFFDFLRE